MKKLTALLVALFTLTLSAFSATNYTLMWDASTDVVNGYNVYQSIGVGSTNFIKIGSTNALLFPLGTLSTNFYTWYATAFITSTNGVLESLPSNTTTLDLRIKPIIPPSNILVLDDSQLVVNGSFEGKTNNWIVTGNFDVPYFTAQNGTNWLRFNAGNRPPNAVAYQTVPTVAGAKYVLAFYIGAMGLQQPQSIKVTAGPVSQTYTVTAAVVSYTSIAFSPQKIVFTATSNQTTIMFQDVSTYTDSVDCGIDNVQLYRILAP